jgi:hypothetical protein
MVYGEAFLRNFKFYAKTLTKLHDLTVHLHKYLDLLHPVLWIHDILGWIRIWIRGSMPLTNGSGLLLFEDKKSKRSHKAVGIKAFLTFFAW